MASGGAATREDPDELARELAILANGMRLRVLHRLASPAFVPDLTRELGLTRQALQRHLDELESLGLVESGRERRGALPATRYVASPAGMFAFKEKVLALALPPAPPRAAPALTQPAKPAPARAAGKGPGLLLVHGDAPGRWFGLAGGTSWIVGRDPRTEVRLAYDPFVSARHAHIQREGALWRVTDLHSTNGMSVNFEPLSPGEERALATGDVLTVGKSRLVFRGA